MPSLALVTGANRGLGEGVARRLAALGHTVLVGARDLASGERVAASLRSSGLEAEAVQLDVTRAEDREAVAARLERDGGALSILVNNAGVYEGPPRTIVDVDFHAPRLLTDRLRGRLAPGARIVMVSSGLGSLSAFPPALARRFDPAPTLPRLLSLVDEYLADAEGGGRRGWPSAYTVAKAALNALSRIVASDLGERARVNAVSPGWVKTRMGGAGAPKSLAEGVAGLVWAATLPADGPTGGFFEDGEALRW